MSSWRVCVHEECVSGSIALYLELVGESKGIVIAELQFSLLCHGTKLVSVDDDGRITDTSITFNAEVASRAFKDIITKGELEKPEYLEDDTILVRCDITVANELSSSGVTLRSSTSSFATAMTMSTSTLAAARRRCRRAMSWHKICRRIPPRPSP